MPETKTKKVRVYKLASEYNLSAENLIEFLQKKGHEVKSHMSMLNDEMIKDINAHFKKDIEKAEKHYKKIAEFNKKREEKVEEEEQKAVKQEPELEQIEEAKEEETAEVPVEEETAEQQAEEVEEGAQAEIVQEEIKTPVETSRAEETVEEKEPKEDEFKAPSEVEKDKKRGLKVIGKMDLGEEEKKKTLSDEGQGKEEKPKKKRKKPKARKKSTETSDEQVPAKKRKRIKRFEIDEKEVKAAIKKTLLSMDDSIASGRASARKKKRREREAEEERRLEEKSQEQKTIVVNEFIAVSELANLMGVPVSDVIQKFIELGLMVSINQRLDVDTITLVADEFGFDVKFQEEYTSEALEDFEDDPETLESRPPIVTIMGHVDHGKTSLLDYIRRTNVVAGESGGITQHIGAYKVDVGNGKKITFLDTPGHEAFTAMRARGAQLTDIVVLIIAADDAVMPQTIEAINHAQAANVPIVIAINKIDKPGANSDKIKQQLADRKILVEDWGGKYQCVEVSAKTGLNVENLLEVILLEAELLDLKANPNRSSRGTVVESELDKGRGITGTILVQKGTLKIGDPFVAGIFQGKVRAMFDERGKKVDEAPPATPVLVLGFEGAP
ncbi:MAG: translation initiation factor IF-2, partial [Ignavibacteriaceae bacterium]